MLNPVTHLCLIILRSPWKDVNNMKKVWCSPWHRRLTALMPFQTVLLVTSMKEWRPLQPNQAIIKETSLKVQKVSPKVKVCLTRLATTIKGIKISCSSSQRRGLKITRDREQVKTILQIVLVGVPMLRAWSSLSLLTIQGTQNMKMIRKKRTRDTVLMMITNRQSMLQQGHQLNRP